MRIETERLTLRPFAAQDLEDLLEYLSDEETLRYEPYLPMNRQEAEQELAWRMTREEMIAVEHRQDGKLIGNLYLGQRDCENKELGYVFNRAYWHKGYAKEACLALMAESFAAGTHRIYAECDPQNPASWHLLEALGFERAGHFRQNVYFFRDKEGKPIWKDTYLYEKLEDGAE